MAEPNIYWAGTPNYTPGNYGIVALFPHWTCGGFEGSVSTLQNPDRQASAHYVIEGGTVAQLVDESDSAWHCGNYYYNMRAISYELVGWPGNPPSYETLDTCARMMAQASRDYFGGAQLILGENVMLHKWVYATGCPGETDVDWLVNRANMYLNGGAPEPEPEPEPEQKPGKPVNKAGLWYRAHVQDLGWCEAVHDGQTAGTVGFKKQMEALKVTPPDGWVLDIALHISNVGWKHYKGIQKGVKDPVMGTTGKGQAIEDVLISVAKRPEGDKRKLYFKVHQAGTGWKDWTKEGFSSGSDGLSIQLEAIKMKVV